MFEIARYTADDREAWDDYVARRSKNATFLHLRGYMDYHADRFSDYSLLFYLRGRLYALLPAHQEGDTLRSHGGLTYGGLLTDHHCLAADVCQLFREMQAWLRGHGISHMVYSPAPWIYHSEPAEEDQYALFHVCHARLTRRSISTTLPLQHPTPWRENHRRMLIRARRAGVAVAADAAMDDFWPVLTGHLREKYGVAPVHSLAEIQLLRSRFPENIIQYLALLGSEVIGGVTLYVTPRVVHTQYIATTAAGNRLGALPAIIHEIIARYSDTHEYLDWGTSCEQQGRYLNESLILHKQGYGGRAITYDTYEWDIPTSPNS